ncbi:probable pectinesterase 55 [Macadamia integrifolia]|uniref:probable pectinesterase 55 n=1 Tax=Macadamia integrifolia TaxID=60698 RepID=UPI001C5275C3|nr:probable pectinesterase 55 [Macadamia integrifolia]
MMMQLFSKLFIFISMALRWSLDFPLIREATVDCGSNVAYTITVDKNGHGNFTTVQGAIDSIPSNNNQWVCISVQAGIYIEQVTIDQDKPCIFLKGVNRSVTSIEYAAHGQLNTTPTFSSKADNFVAKDISFKNTFNLGSYEEVSPATAVLVYGDKAAFYSCGFYGLQDTLWDQLGRHYFEQCYVEGSVDFIFGLGYSMYKDCVISVTPVKNPGFITAQHRNSPNEINGYVFNGGSVVGEGTAYLGRAYGPYSTVIWYGTSFFKGVVPQGWDNWNRTGQEPNFTYAEVNCSGPGADTSKRVKWEKKLSDSELQKFIQPSLSIDSDGWIAKQPHS